MDSDGSDRGSVMARSDFLAEVGHGDAVQRVEVVAGDGTESVMADDLASLRAAHEMVEEAKGVAALL